MEKGDREMATIKIPDEYLLELEAYKDRLGELAHAGVIADEDSGGYLALPARCNLTGSSGGIGRTFGTGDDPAGPDSGSLSPMDRADGRGRTGMKVVADSGPLMALGKLGMLDLLYHLYGQVHIPSAVHDEVVVWGSKHGYPDACAARLAVQRGKLVVATIKDEDLTHEISSLPLDIGEKHSLYLAIRDEADLVLFDDLKAREEARAHDLTVKGTLGVIVQAYRAGRLHLDEAETLIQAIIVRDDIWIAEAVCLRVLTALRTEIQGNKHDENPFL
jgi:predicted nucleic acid-binding protein